MTGPVRSPQPPMRQRPLKAPESATPRDKRGDAGGDLMDETGSRESVDEADREGKGRIAGAPRYRLDSDADSVRVLADGRVIWLARCIAPHRYEVLPVDPLIPRCKGQRQALVAVYIAACWRRARRHLLVGKGPTTGAVRRAWIEHWRAWRRATN